MKALIQRVDKASVTVAEQVVGSIGKGLVVFLGVEATDTERDVDYLVDKSKGLRIFSDSEGKFNLSCVDTGGSFLIVSQFTLIADTRRGKRPSFTRAAGPERAQQLIDTFVKRLKEAGIKVATGIFQSHMKVEIHNDGPVTIMIDSKDKIG